MDAPDRLSIEEMAVLFWASWVGPIALPYSTTSGNTPSGDPTSDVLSRLGEPLPRRLTGHAESFTDQLPRHLPLAQRRNVRGQMIAGSVCDGR